MATVKREGFVPSSELDLTSFIVGGREIKVEESGELQSARQFFPYKPEHFTKPAKEKQPIPLVKGIMAMDVHLELRRSVGLDGIKYYKERWIPATIGGDKVTVKTFDSEEYRQLYIHYQCIFDTWIKVNDEVKNYKMGWYVDPTKSVADQTELRTKLICQAIEKYGDKYPALVFSMTAQIPKKSAYPYAIVRFEKYDDAKNIIGVPKELFARLPTSGQAPIAMADVGIFTTLTIDKPISDEDNLLEE